MSKTRRKFLRQAGTFAGGLALAPQLAACGSERATTQAASVSAAAPQAKRKLGVALLGLGSYARGQIAPALQLTEHCELRGLITGSPNKLPEWQQRYGVAEQHCYTYDTMAQLADDDAIDVVYVITPTATHRTFTERAAAAGKHVWCEKPMAMTPADCQAMIDACAAANVRLAIGYRMLHEPNTQTFIGARDAKAFGSLQRMTSQAGYAGSDPPTDYWRGQRAMGGGALYDMGVYTVNGLRYASGQLPVAVVRAQQLRPTEVDVTTTYTLRFPNGLRAEGKTSVVEKCNLLRNDYATGAWLQLEPMQPYSGVKGSASDARAFPAAIESPHQQRLQMDDDAQALLQGTPFLAPGEEGMIDIAIIRAIIESAETGKEITIRYS